MVSTQNKQMAQFLASMTERMSRTDLDLATIRDVYENLHLEAREPEGVCYADVDIDGVPALWCVPTDCDVDRVLLHAHDYEQTAHAYGANTGRLLQLKRLVDPQGVFTSAIPLPLQTAA